MSEKTAKKLRQALRNVNVDFETAKYFRDRKTGTIVASEGHRIYKRAKRKANEMRRRSELPVI